MHELKKGIKLYITYSIRFNKDAELGLIYAAVRRKNNKKRREKKRVKSDPGAESSSSSCHNIIKD